MELIGAGLAGLGIIGPGIGVGILTGMSTSAIGRNPDAAGVIRQNFILGLVLAEGLGIFAFVLGVLILVL
jgi:F-type H+-transporting ATPase subunit c